MEEMVERYCAATGRDGVPDLNWYFSYNLFRLTGIVQGIKKRIVDGTASSAQAEKSAAGVYRLASAAWEFAVKAGAE
jgi:aminoglycoside phosphotransferase (APT) family kinase protein